MSDIAIRVENLGKQYRIGALQKGGGYSYRSLRDAIASAASAPFRAARALMGRNGSHHDQQEDTIWALKDVSFDVRKGEIVGVIGRNGAGKSTLLKLLSRITEPTTGRAEIHGRIGSLLEVGTGFHPELTGRDNVYMNGAILGMKNAEIARQFDEIVAFAEVEKFIDTPVKHYSSGMYLRLAFAVAAHLQTEILIVDEVLAVGDQAFQSKCLGRMQNIARLGRTVVFVSHNMAAISSLCASAILLEQGKIAEIGAADGVLRRYLSNDDSQNSAVFRREQLDRSPDSTIRIEKASISDATGLLTSSFDLGDTIHFRFLIRGAPLRIPVQFVVQIHTSTGIPVLHLMSNYCQPVFSGENAMVQCTLKDCPLYPGQYSVSIWAGASPDQTLDVVSQVLTFSVRAAILPGCDVNLTWRHGLVHCDTSWSFTGTDEGIPN